MMEDIPNAYMKACMKIMLHYSDLQHLLHLLPRKL